MMEVNMQLDKFLPELYNVCENYNMPPDLLLALIDAQEIKRYQRGQEADMEKSFKTITRYLRIKDI